MKKISGLIIFLGLAITGYSAGNTRPVGGERVVDLYEYEKNILMRRISFEKARIESEFCTADTALFSVVDVLTRQINGQQTTRDKRNLYLKRLQVFLSNINRSCTDGPSETQIYLASLSFFPEIMEHDQKRDLIQFLRSKMPLALQSIRLIPEDGTAELFLNTYMKEHPDDIFRYTEQFDDRKFALNLLERAVKNAPESARRYYRTNNAVRDLLITSKDAAAVKSFELYGKYGAKSLTCILLTEIIRGTLTDAMADSIAQNPENMFNTLFQLSVVQKAPINYSAKRFVEIYGSLLMRQINHMALQPGYEYDEFLHYSNDQMFLLLAVGHKETTEPAFHAMLDLFHRSLGRAYVRDEMLDIVGIDNLRSLFAFCKEAKLTDELLYLFPKEKEEYLLALTRPVETDIPLATAVTGSGVQAEAMNASHMTPHLLKMESRIDASSKKIPAFVPMTPVVVSASLDKKEVIPIPPPEKIEPVNIVLDSKTRKVLAMQKNIYQTIQNIPSFINESYAEEVLMYAAQREPDELLKKTDAFKSKYYSKKVIERCAYYAPVSVRRYLYNPYHSVNVILQTSDDPVVKKILALHAEIGYQSKPLLLIEEIMAKKLTTKEAIAICGESNKLFSAVSKIISKPYYVGKYSIDHEMRDFSLHFIRDINDKIAAGGHEPFASIEVFSSEELYFLMLFGRDEVFTSTFNGLFNRFVQKLPQGDGDAFFRSVNRNQFRNFISLCSNFGRMEEFLTKFTPTAKEKLLIAYTSNLEGEKDDLTSVVLVVEAISNMTDTRLLALLQSNIKREYERMIASDDQIGISLYGVLSSMIAGNAQVEEGWYKKVSQQFKITPVSSLPSSALFDTADVCAEQMYFYNDADGRSSYINFLNTFRTQPNWAIEDRSTFTRIYAKRGLKVEIFANKPEFEEEGVTAINHYMKERYLLPAVVVHRGHSFHTESTLEKIPPSAKLIFVGSCGGFYKISLALENAPEAHIISTKQIGTKTLNDAMLFALNENIRNGNDIEWNEFWDKMRDKFPNDRYFSDYIPPNKNLESIFIRAYYKMLGV